MDTPIPETEREAEKVARGEEALDRIQSGQHWRDWMYVADGFVVGRDWALRSLANRHGIGTSPYNKAFGRWLDQHPKYGEINKATRAHMFWCDDHRSELEAWRDGLKPNERNKMNHPSVVKRRHEAMEAAKHAYPKDPSAPKPEMVEVKELVAENTRLKFDLEAVSRRAAMYQEQALAKPTDADNALPEAVLRAGPVADILDTLFEVMDFDRFMALHKAMVAKLTRLKAMVKEAQPKPRDKNRGRTEKRAAARAAKALAKVESA